MQHTGMAGEPGGYVPCVNGSRDTQADGGLEAFTLPVHERQSQQLEPEPLGIGEQTDHPVIWIGHDRFDDDLDHRVRQHGALLRRSSRLLEPFATDRDFLPTSDDHILFCQQESRKAAMKQNKRSDMRSDGDVVGLDRMDRKILSALRSNGRLTMAELEKAVGRSQSPCWTRVKRLEACGAIEGYVAVLSHKAIGVPNVVFVEVTLDRHDEKVLEQFGQSPGGRFPR